MVFNEYRVFFGAKFLLVRKRKNILNFGGDSVKLTEIKDFWEKSGENFPLNAKVTPTSRDPYLGELERTYILQHLEKEHTCLEIGCGDAFHGVHYAEKSQTYYGVDVAQSLIQLAEERKNALSLENASFFVGSVLDIREKFPEEKFDRIISQRCLINLPAWELQRKALLQIYDLLAPGGMLLLTEGFQENLENLNQARKMFDLPTINVVDYNRNFEKKEFESFINGYFHIENLLNYGSYIFFSRLYHPMVVFPDAPKHDSVMNKVAMELQKKMDLKGLDDYSYNLFYVLRKK